MKRVKISDEALSGVNIVPVIGVCLVLLVILIVMSPIMNLPNLDVDLPEALTRETKEQNLTVSLGADGRISLGLKIIEDWTKFPPMLKGALKDEQYDTVVIIRADKNHNYGIVEKLVRLVNRHAGGRPVALATRQRNEELEIIEK